LYLAERKASGEDVDRTYVVAETRVSDPWGGPVMVAYAVPVVRET
jgi:hypothetical protein